MAQLDLQRYVVEVLERLQIPYFITGSVATIFFGEPRLTNDIDIVADVRETHLDSLLRAFPDNEFYLSADAIRHALRHKSQFNIIHPSSGLKVDVIVPTGSDHDRSRFERRAKVRVADDYDAYLTSPEDVIIRKMMAYDEGGSDKHLRDISGILKVLGPQVDRKYVATWAEKLQLDQIWAAITSQV